MGVKHSNNASAKLATSVNNSSDFQFTVESLKGDLFPVGGGADYFYATLEDEAANVEVWKITARSAGSDVFSAGSAANRAQDGTIMRAFAAGDIVECRLIGKVIDDALAHVDDTSGAHAATAISFTPAGNISSDNVQDALEELDSETAAAIAAKSDAGILDAEQNTRMVFQQSAAPTGWTKETAAAYNDAALRIVTGAVTTGGADNFSTHFGTSKSTAGHAITTPQMPVHGHGVTDPGHLHASSGLGGAGGNSAFINGGLLAVSPTAVTGITINNAGSGQVHSHTLSNFNIKFADIIICTKD